MYIARLRTEREAEVVLRGMDRHVPSGPLVVWDFSDVDNGFVGSDEDLSRLRAMLSGWGEVVDDEDDNYEGDESGYPDPVKVVPRELSDEDRLISVCALLRRVGYIHESVVGG